MITLAAIFRTEVSEDSILGCWSVLKQQLTINEMEQAVSLSGAKLTFMPKPAELIELVRPSKAILAWMTFAKHARRSLRHSLDFADPITNAVARSKGGLRQAYLMDEAEFWSFYRRDFLAAYAAIESQSDHSTIDSRPLFITGNHEGETTKPVLRIECSYLQPSAVRLSNDQRRIGGGND